jgi:hypothetical protein
VGARVDEQVAEHGDGRGAGADHGVAPNPPTAPRYSATTRRARAQQMPDVGGIRAGPLLVLAGRERDPAMASVSEAAASLIVMPFGSSLARSAAPAGGHAEAV